MIRVDNAAPAMFDLGQIKALAVARFGSALIDCNTSADGAQVFVYLPATPNGAKAAAWTNDLAGYVMSAPTAADLAANQATILQRAQQALTANATYLANQTPTNNQTALQVQALTKQVNGLLRALLGQYDSTSGT